MLSRLANPGSFMRWSGPTMIPLALATALALAVGLYLALGWSGVIAYDTVVNALPVLTLWFIGAGGVLYTLGVVFHAWQRLRFQNAIWHGFVLLGAACHYTAVLDLVLST